MNARIKLIEWFMHGAIERVLTSAIHISKYYEDRQRASELGFQISRLRSLNDSKRKNLLSQADYQLEFDKIRQSTLEIIEDIPDDWDVRYLPEISVTANYKNHFMILIMILVLFFGAFSLISYWKNQDKPSVSQTSAAQKELPQNNPKDKADTIISPKETPRKHTPPAIKERLTLRAKVADAATNLGMGGVTVFIEGVSIKTTEGGFFEYVVPDPKQHNTADAISVSFEKEGYHPANELMYIPGSTNKIIYLSKIK